MKMNYLGICVGRHNDKMTIQEYLNHLRGQLSNVRGTTKPKGCGSHQLNVKKVLIGYRAKERRLGASMTVPFTSAIV